MKDLVVMFITEENVEVLVTDKSIFDRVYKSNGVLKSNVFAYGVGRDIEIAKQDFEENTICKLKQMHDSEDFLPLVINNIFKRYGDEIEVINDDIDMYHGRYLFAVRLADTLFIIRNNEGVYSWQDLSTIAITKGKSFMFDVCPKLKNGGVVIY